MKRHFFHQLSARVRNSSVAKAKYFPQKPDTITNRHPIDATFASDFQKTKVLLGSESRLPDELEFIQMYGSFEQPEVE